MIKCYEYDDKIYCKDDLSCDIDNYGGDLFDLYYDLEKHHIAHNATLYYADCPESIDDYFESIEELIENKFDYLEVNPNLLVEDGD